MVGGAKKRLPRKNLAQALAVPPGAAELAAREERAARRDFHLSGAALAVALVGRLACPPLALLAAPPLVFLMWPLFQGAWQDLTRRRCIKFRGQTSLFVVGALLLGAYVPAAVDMFVYMYSFTLVHRTRDRSQRQLIGMFDRQPRDVWRLVDGAELETPLHAVKAGDILVAHAGQAVPADGVVTAGMATVDQHRLTGEAQPAEKAAGDAVFAGTLVLRGWLHLRVEKAGRETLTMQIAEVLERTTAYHLAAEGRGQQLLESTVPPTLLLSALALPLLGFKAAIAELFTAPGADLRYAAPLALLNFLHLSTRQGILVKDGRSLELLHGVDTVVFDKTGTLTLEQPEVGAVHVCGGFDADTVLAYAAAAERRQSHPVALAILAESVRRGLSPPEAGESRCDIGFGVRVSADGRAVRVGSLRFMGNENLAVPPSLAQAQAGCAAAGHSLVYVAIGEALAGAVELRPCLRPEAQAVVAQLQARGLRLAILSGDRVEPTRHLAARLGIEDYFAEVLPQDKAGHIERLQRQGRSVCFVGDGINDAVALKTAQVSISLHGAAALAQDAAQIVMMEPSLAQLPVLFALAERLERNLLVSLRISVGAGCAIVGSIFLLQAGIGTVVGLDMLAKLGIGGNAMLPLLETLERE